MASKRKILKYTGIGLLALIVLTLIFLPVLIKNYTIRNSKELLGRQIDIGKLKFNYFTSTATVYDFKMYEANEQDVFTSFDTLIVNTVPYKYLGNIKALDQFYLEGLTVNIAKDGDAYNFDDLIAFYTAGDSTVAESEAEEEFKYILENLELKNGRVNFYDAEVDQTTEITDLDLLVPIIMWDQQNDSEAGITFNLGPYGTVTSKTGVNPGTGDFLSNVTVSGLQLNAFNKYAAAYAEISELGGTVNAELVLKGNIDTPMETLLSGEVNAVQPLMKDNGNTTFLSSESIRCVLDEINYSGNSYRIGELAFEQPYLKFELDSVSNNLFRIFKLDEEVSDLTTVEPSATADSTALYYAVQNLKVNQGKMDYTDNLTGQPFDYGLSQIEIDADSIYSDSEWTDILATMLLNERGKLKAEIGYNPQDPTYADIDIGIEEFVLSDLNIYSSYYTGHSILNGDMFYFSDTKITGGQLESENNLLIKNVSVENIKGGLFAIPLKLAVWLLKDKNGDIELDVPVRGDMNDPEVDTWALIGATLKKKIFDTTDNPVLPLARFIDADPDDLRSLALQYPDTALTENHMRQLDLILELERQKEGLSVEINFVGEDSLKTIMATSELSQGFMQETKKDSIENREAFEKYISQQAGSDSLGLDGSLMQYAAAKGLDSLASGYMNTMIRKVDSYLKAQEPSTEIVVQKAKVSDKENVEAAPEFRMKYSLKEPDEQEAPSGDTVTSKPEE
ncbi:DUF748 domain-containing protein [Robiginitalea aurantiaca]|uniref:DUF748 domain-containing protein n=1 Tax=Robiginitalea aurantiaca TaxID=3056915 RepID=A0ABT7WH52_9FLAO|nr:DUF748 domain-containing protein [Robiginitalea aurantiaca]MDM9632250.1 DUF748 domain-containing protein [Robiginitalea aurantiaca]